ncbi:hypothetical protein GR198_05860 [Rhizobium leguminosarum]|uniref:hypothetical protein n=1 Tax=Rhizobium leguminosarum TaxID=384 RepID=UPI0013C11CF1|nr:hypothetical protein [Rhizobium leguminosarum]NEH55271.1 hypothetical protein [Rhizobium leguminosarum]
MTASDAVDTLLHGLYDRRNVEEAVSTLIGSHISRAGRIVGPVYVVGNGGDFREVAVPIAKSLGTSLAGVACLWTHQMEYLRPDGRPAFSIPNECMERSKSAAPTLLFCQTIIATAEEMIAMISRVLNTRSAEAIVVSGILMNADTKEELRSYFGTDIDIDFYGIDVDQSLLDIRDAVFWALDDRKVKVAPLVSRWLANRLFAPKPELKKADGQG